MQQTLKKISEFCLHYLEIILIIGVVLLALLHFLYKPLATNSLQSIQERGSLKVLISDDPDAQYHFNKQYYGFEFELLRTFADSLDVKLDVDVVPYGQLFTLLTNGAADMAVGGILQSPFIEIIIEPSIPWHQAEMTVVYKRGTKRPTSIKKLEKDHLYASARYYQLEGFDNLNITDDYRSEYDLLQAVNDGSINYALSTNYRARNAKHYLPNLNRAFVLDNPVELVWALPKRNDGTLLSVLNQFLQTAVDQNLPKVLANHYFTHKKILNTYDVLGIHKRIQTKLPEFEHLFRRAARRSDIDWFLIAAMAYQESHWSNSAVSPTGVKGIMQLTLETADFLDVSDRMDINESIYGAANYIGFLKSKLPRRIKEPQRTWFAVGAYNIGLGHVLEAYRKANRLNLDPTQWEVIGELLPTLYGKPFSRGVQAKDYVERIQIFTDIMRFYDQHQRNNKKQYTKFMNNTKNTSELTSN